MSARAARPKFLHLGKIRLPIMGLVSISHRISGFLLFLCLPLAIALLELSLQSEQGFARALGLLHGLPVRLLCGLGLWWFGHHLLAGMRYLALDVEWGVSLPAARRTAYAVFLASALVLLGVGVMLL